MISSEWNHFGQTRCETCEEKYPAKNEERVLTNFRQHIKDKERDPERLRKIGEIDHEYL